MIKFVGLILLSIAISSFGFLYYEKLKSRERYLEAIKHFSNSCVEQMRYTSKSIFEIFSENSEDELQFLKKVNSENILNTEEISELLQENNVLDADKKAITSFLEKLGDSDIDSQKAHCKYYFDYFSQQLEGAREESSQKGRLYISMFVFAGAAIFIIFI